MQSWCDKLGFQQDGIHPIKVTEAIALPYFYRKAIAAIGIGITANI
ncbi:hypothetical protein [[Limnothrix rosea] IAM M-220]|nr:hypothetical protein [[Limnothrix rosea] IAM M-220]